MTTLEKMPATTTFHEGNKMKRLREMMRIKQETLGGKIGLSQQSISLLEQKETVEPEILEKVLAELGITLEAFHAFDEEATITNFITNNFHSNANIGSASGHSNTNSTITYDPIEKLTEVFNMQIAIFQKKIDEQNAMIERLLNK